MLRLIRPDFEVVKEGRILNLVLGYRRVTIVCMACDEKSSLVDKRVEISNQILIKNMVDISKLEEVIS